MAITIDSTVEEILANEKVLEVVKKFIPKITSPGIKQVATMPLSAVCEFPQAGLTKEKIQELAAAIEVLGE